MKDYISPAQKKQVKRIVLARYGLVIANQGNAFWTKSDAMQHINLVTGV